VPVVRHSPPCKLKDAHHNVRYESQLVTPPPPRFATWTFYYNNYPP
jgi:hypothetical protein